jgi:hypothetical protein
VARVQGAADSGSAVQTVAVGDVPCDVEDECQLAKALTEHHQNGMLTVHMVLHGRMGHSHGPCMGPQGPHVTRVGGWWSVGGARGLGLENVA